MSRARQAAAALAAVFGSPQLRRAELAWGGSIAAEWAHFVALGVFAYEQGGAVAVGIAGVIRMLPAALVGPFAAAAGDRWRRERFLLVVSAVGAAALAGSSLAFYATEGPVAVYVLAAAVGVTTTLFRPALQALLPSLARTPSELVAANGATSTIESFATLVGPVVAGVVVAFVDPGAVFAVGAVALVGSTLLLARVRVEGPSQRARAAGGGLGELLAGFSVLLRARDPRLITSLMVAQAFVRGCLNVLIVVVAFEVLDAGEGMVGYLTAALGVGGLLGAFGAATLAGRRLAVPLGISLVFWGLPIALVAPVPDALAALLLLAVVGAANSVEDVAGFTLLQRIVPDAALTRALGAFWGFAMGGVALGSLVAPLVVEGVGARGALIVVGALLPALIAVSWRRLREIDSATAPAPELELVQGVELFAPLSVAAKEHVARALVPVDVRAGDAVVRAGEPGDRFYVLASGELEVEAEAQGRRTRLDRPGDYLGEIALLRSIPRTATVTALTDARLYALEREDFLAAVTGHSAVSAAADAVVERRLARAATE
ncbi:MAG: MFS transporter [Thermoleophilia bacterium]|nr:MFS transporter [Thermoleophilia bacterium]